MYDLGMNFRVDIKKSKTPSAHVYRGNKYRISILSDSLIRFEYSETGSFNDYPTFFATNRNFANPKTSVEEDNNILIIKGEKFVLEYQKEKPFVSGKHSPDQNLKVTIKDTDKTWHFSHPEAKNFGGTCYSLDESVGKVTFDKGLFSIDGFASFDDSRTPILDQNGNIITPNYKNTDTYLFVYNNDFGYGLRDYFNLTGLPPLIPRYALGVWWAKNEPYTESDVQILVNKFKKSGIPLSVLLLGEYARTKNKYSNISFSFNKSIFPNPPALANYLHANNIFLGTNVITDGILSIEEEHHADFIKIYDLDTDKNIPLNVYNSKLMDGFLKGIITPYMNSGVDFLWVDDYNVENKLRDYAMNYYLYNNMTGNVQKRNMVLSRNFGIAPHKYSILYSGRTLISWKILKLLPFFNSTAANIGVSWWSHDIGGFDSGTEDAELYMRYVQLGVYSPILRLASEGGKYYKREPWRWNAETYNIVKEYLVLRHRLIPYLYSEAKKYSTNGVPLLQPLYYKYPETYDEPLYKTEYYFGSELFISPIVYPKDSVMNRSVHRLFLPNGVWYEFKTGKKFIGGKRYVTFYKDEDYPVFAKTGAIIPMAKLDPNNLNDVSSPKTLEIHVFPGRSNTYKLYEDDGFSSKYKTGESLTTEINYYYKTNDFSVSIAPIAGTTAVVPPKRNYIIRFRNTKFTDGVQVFANEVNVPFRRYTDETDFVIEFDEIPVQSKILVYCKGQDIEIDAARVINEDLEGIINDLSIPTELKEQIDSIIFDPQKTIREKRILIRKLRREGLPKIFVNMFMQLFEYMAEL